MKHHFVKHGVFQTGLVFFPVSSKEQDFECGGAQ